MKRHLLALLLILGLGGGAPAAFDLTSLQLTYGFNEGTGSTTADSSGNSRTGTLVNTPTWTSPGKTGANCLSFASASSEQVTVGSPAGLLKNTGEATLACWFKTSSATQQFLITILNGSGTSRASLFLNSSGALVANGRAGDAESAQIKTSTPTGYNDGNWHHAAAVINYASDTITLYIDGSAITSTGTIAFTATATSNTDSIGATIASRSADYVNGEMDDVVVFARALTAPEIATMAASTNGYPWDNDVIACTDQTSGRIYQRAKNTTAKTITFAGTYTGTAPASIEVRIVNQSGGATIQDWTALTSATIGGGNWSGSLSVPQGSWYNFLARGKNGGGTVLATSAQTSNKFGVGILIGCIGQSNMRNMTTVSSSPPASSDHTRMYSSSTWGVVTGNGSIRLANLLQTETSLPIGILPYAVGGTAISTWDDVGDTQWDAFAAGLSGAGGDCEFILWHQGETDAIAGTAKATYKTALDDVYALCRSVTGRSTSEIRFGCALLGNISDGTATDATTDAIRQGQDEWIPATTGAFFLGSTVDMVRTDQYHWTAPYYERAARRYTQSLAKLLATETYGADGPHIVSARRSGAVVYVTVAHDGGTALKELDGSTDGGSLTGFELSEDDFSSNLTISSTAFSAGEIAITLSTTPTGTVKLRYQYGENPSITNPVYDDFTPQGDTIGLPLQPKAAITVAVVKPLPPFLLQSLSKASAPKRYLEPHYSVAP